VTTDRSRRHTGRRRNDEAREAILEAAATLLAGPDGMAVTIEAIAAAAGVGRQTIYRWWPSKGAVLLDAMTERAAVEVPVPDQGSLLDDLRWFLTATFRSATAAAPVLRGVMAEAQRDPHAAELLVGFTGRRRAALRELIGRSRARGEVAEHADVELLVDQAFGVLWYRLLTGHGELTDAAAERLAVSLAGQATADEEVGASGRAC
jgi:AcrR family transcriptional regulator